MAKYQLDIYELCSIRTGRRVSRNLGMFTKREVEKINIQRYLEGLPSRWVLCKTEKCVSG